jgi:CII-binding regulator of phage lambda lysogenization HflD
MKETQSDITTKSTGLSRRKLMNYETELKTLAQKVEYLRDEQSSLKKEILILKDQNEKYEQVIKKLTGKSADIYLVTEEGEKN